MKKYLVLIMLFFSIPSYADNEVTVGGQTGRGHIIQDEGSNLRQRPYMNFTGSGVTCVDTGGKTVCTMSGGSGGGSGNNIFMTIDTSSGTDVVADQTEDTLILSGSGGITVTGTSATDTITIGMTESDPQVGGVTNDSVCQGDGAATNCNLTKDASGSCGAGNVCMGGHTHATTEISGVNAGTDLTADLEEEVTEGSLADSTIVSADIKDATIAGGDLASNIAITSTGAQDFGGATSVEVPNGASPTVDAAGEIAVDTTDDQLIYYGGAKRVIPYSQERCFTVGSPAAADDGVPVWTPFEAITVTSTNCRVSDGTSATIIIRDQANNQMSTMTCDTNGVTGTPLGYNTWTAGEGMSYDTSAVSGTVTWLNYCLKYTINAQ